MSAADADRRDSAAAAAVGGIRQMIRNRELLPGEPVRQQDMAERLGVSRVPVREALHALETEGLLRHQRHQGYFVAKLSADQLSQIYLMRRLLETALLQHLRWPDEQKLAVITALNDQLARAAQDGRVAEMAKLNRQFHEAIFDLSPLATVHQEISRLWELSEPYRAVYLAGPSRLRTASQHEEMIDALRHHDLDGLLERLDRHRTQAQDEVAAMLGGPAMTDLSPPRVEPG